MTGRVLVTVVRLQVVGHPNSELKKDVNDR
jgi:hypothetical protein